MLACGICIEALESPVSLPCGHLFCNECIHRAVESVVPYSSLHSCPMCRLPYTVANLDVANVPAHLRPHIIPSIRTLYLDLPNQAPRTISAATEIAVENSRLHAENAALRNTCGMWRRRAELHGAATLGLLGFARTVRDEAIKMRRERDELYKHYNLLREKLPPSDSSLLLHPPPPSATAELPPLPQTFTEALAPSKTESVVPPSRCNRNAPESIVDKEALTRPTKRTRLADPGLTT